LGQYISGVILYEETLFQKNAAGRPFVEILQEQGIIPGIKVDKVISISIFYLLSNSHSFDSLDIFIR
jgi:fructose-bisphosphate aldolase class 1